MPSKCISISSLCVVTYINLDFKSSLSTIDLESDAFI